ncbi:MAG: hypothetical protein QHJ73_06290, partial [Armatimonadota bacterium]|nr:hypothetical protein [Armatimonadota bacterium]
LILPYCKSTDVFVCPEHKVRGWAPTCFTTPPVTPPPGQVSLRPLNDVQVPRLSYVPNELLMPRKKFAAVPQQCVFLSMVDEAASTIMIAEYTDSVNCLLDSSPTGGDAIKSHRPTSGVKLYSGGVFDGESYVPGTYLMALTPTEALHAIETAKTSSAVGKHHIAYINPEMHSGGSNYVFADGHAKWMTLSQTLDPNNFQWGKRAYSCPGMLPVLRPGSTVPVN